MLLGKIIKEVVGGHYVWAKVVAVGAIGSTAVAGMLTLSPNSNTNKDTFEKPAIVQTVEKKADSFSAPNNIAQKPVSKPLGQQAIQSVPSPISSYSGSSQPSYYSEPMVPMARPDQQVMNRADPLPDTAAGSSPPPAIVTEPQPVAPAQATLFAPIMGAVYYPQAVTNDTATNTTQATGVAASSSSSADTSLNTQVLPEPFEITLTESVPSITNVANLTVSYAIKGISKTKQFNLTEGENKLAITELSADGKSASKDLTVTLDTVPPLIEVTSDVPALTNKSALSVAYTSDKAAKSKVFTLIEGPNHLEINETDAATNSASKAYDVVLDTVPPALFVNTNIPNITNIDTINVDYAADGVAKSKSFTLVEGSNQLVISETDPAGNTATKEYALTLDTIAPAILIHDTLTLTNNPSLTLSYSSDSVEKTKGFILTEGANHLVITETDTAGNTASASADVVLDTAAPAMATVGSVPSITNKPDLKIKYTADGVEKEKDFTLTEGANHLVITETDEAGNPRNLTYDVVLDTIKPEIILTSIVPELTNKPALTVEYRSDGVAKSKSFTLTEGPNHPIISETDEAGNTATKEYDLTLDTIAPSILIHDTLTLTKDPNFTVYYTSDGVEKTKTCVLVEGVNRIILEETDAAGNILTKAHDVTLDTIPPEILVTSSVPVLTNNPALIITYKSDGIAKNKQFVLTEGDNHLTITETDGAGNPASVSYDVSLDTVKPSLSVSSVVPSLTNIPTLVIDYTSDGVAKSKSFTLIEGANHLLISETDPAGNTATKEYALTLDTIAPAILIHDTLTLTNNPSLTLSYSSDSVEKTKGFILTEGSNHLVITETDTAGNTASASADVALDTAAPEVVVTSLIPALTNNPTLIVDYTKDGVSKEKTFALVEGNNHIVISESDPAGNATSVYYDVVLDTTPPVISTASAVSSLTNIPTLVIDYTSDGVAKSKSFTLVEGSNQLVISETDPAGNTATKEYALTLDTIAPAILIHDTLTLTNNPSLTLSYSSDSVEKTKGFILTEGFNHLVITETDTAGNTASASADVALDTVPPAIVLLDAPVITNNANLLVRYTSDGVEKTKSFILAEGFNSLSITETDTAGNSYAKTFSVTLDTIPPAIAITSAPTITNQVNITVTYTVDGQARSKGFALAEGVNHLEIVETDTAGNVSTKVFDVELDTHAPEIVVTSTVPTLTNISPIVISYTLDGVPKTKSFSMVEGPNHLVILETNLAGSSARVEYDVMLDTTPPNIVITSTVPSLTKTPALTISYTSDGTAKSKSFTLIEGANHLVITETDTIGNTSTKSFDVTLDTIAPAIVVTSTVPTLTNNPALTISYTSDGTAKTKSFTMVEGANHLVITETDPAGNSSSVSYDVTLDTVPPAIVVTSTVPTLTNNPALTISYTSDGTAKSKSFTLVEGSNHLVITETDTATNSSSRSFDVTLDTIPPNIVITSAPTITKNNPITVNYTSDGAAKSKSFTLVEGLNNLSITETDTAGNSSTKPFSVTLDTIPPAIVITSTVPALTNQVTLVIDYTSDGTAKSKSFTLIEGANHLVITETDTAGNSSSRSFDVTLDTIPPNIVITSTVPSLTKTPALTISYTSDGTAKSKSFTLIEGANHLVITETDTIGNTSTKSFDVTLDTIAPAIVVTSTVPTLTNNPALTISYTSDGTAKTKSFTMVEGANHLVITETDPAGNSSSVSYDVTLDTVPPAIVVTSTVPTLTNNPALTISYTSDGTAKSKSFTLVEGSNHLVITETDTATNSSSRSFDVTLDTIPPNIVITSAPTITKNNPITVNYTSDGAAKSKSFTLVEGLNNLSITETDTAGNSSTKPFSVTLDTIPPAIVITSTVPALTNQVTLVIDYTSDGTAKSKSFTLIEGANHLVITETDTAGNSSSRSFDVTLDTIPPNIVITSTVPSLTKTPALTISYTSDGTAKSKSFTLIEGANHLVITETDTIGNTSTKSFDVTLDTIAPAIVVTSTVPTLTNNPALTISYTSDGTAKTKSFTMVEGANHLVITETDPAGNSSSVSYDVTLDTVPPVVVVTSTVPTLTNIPVLVIQYTVDGVDKFKMFTLTEGMNHVSFSESDPAGNVTTKTYDLTLDTIPPNIVITSVPTITRTSPVTVRYTSDGVAKTKIFNLVEGVNSLSITEADAAGNSSTRQFDITLDTIPPVIVFKTDIPQTVVNIYSFILEYTVDGAVKFKSFTLVKGNNHMTVTEVDLAGNQSQKSFDIYLIVDNPPVISPIMPLVVRDGQTLIFTVMATDPDGDKLTYSASNMPEGAVFDPVTHKFTWTPAYRQAGIYGVIFTVSDGVLQNNQTVSITVMFNDSDNDGLPDAWEMEQFGDLNQNGTGDTDSDGLTNAEEYKSQTNPNVANLKASLYKPYAMDPAPNYPITGDTYQPVPETYPHRSAHADATDLTDGEHVPSGATWYWPEGVGWMASRYVMMTFDLLSDVPVSTIKYYTSAQYGNVYWQNNIYVLASSDGVDYYLITDMVKDSPPPELPISGTPPVVKHTYVSAGLNTHARYIRLVVFPTDGFNTLDEVEIYSGGQNNPYTGMAVPAGRDETLTWLKLRTRLYADIEMLRNKAYSAALNIDSELDYVGRRIDNFEDYYNEMPAFKTMVPLTPIQPEGLYDSIGLMQQDLIRLNAAILSAEGHAGLIVWKANKWDPIDVYTSPANTTLTDMQLKMMNGERRGEAIILTNAEETDMNVTINIGGFGGDDNPSWIKVNKVQCTDSSDNIMMSDLILEVNKAAGGYPILIPAGMTQQLWIEFAPQSLSQGSHAGSIFVDGGPSPYVVNVNLAISGYRFPDKLTLSLGMWDYYERAVPAANLPVYDLNSGNSQAVKQIMLNYKNDGFWATNACASSTDFARFDAWVAELANAPVYYIFVNADENGDFDGTNMYTDLAAFQAKVMAWAEAWEDHIVSMGMDPDRVAFLVVDEPYYEAREKAVINWGKALRDRPVRYGSKVQLFEDMTLVDPSSVTTLAGDDVFSVSDILCPLDAELIRYDSLYHRLDFYNDQRVSHGKKLAFYSVTDRKVDPYSSNLVREWLAFKYGAYAVKYWSLIDSGQCTNMNEYTAKGEVRSPAYFDGPSVYTSKHLEAIFEGRQDYEYLFILRMFIDHMIDKYPTNPLIADSEATLETAVNAVIADLFSADTAHYDSVIVWDAPKDRSISETQRNLVLDKINAVSSELGVSALHKIEISASAGGSVTPAGSSSSYYAPKKYQIVASGTSQTFTMVPDQGKIIKDVIVDGVSQGAVTSHTFTSVSSDHRIIAVFE